MNSDNKADLVLQNGFVYTVDEQRQRTEAVAVRGNVITYVGDAAGVQEFIGPDTDVINLEGKSIYRDGAL